VTSGTVVEFRILGPLEVVDHEPLSLGGRKQQAVLAVLLLHRGEAVTADRLIEAVWAGHAPATAGKTLQVYVSNLRKVLGDGPLVTQGRAYVLAVAQDQVDSDRFEKLAARGREALERGDPERARVWLEAALGLWRGPALADFSYESFAQSEIARLDEVRTATLESRIEADLRLGRHAALVPELEALVHEHPLRERLYEHLMVALYRSGRQVDALERYQRARRKLIDEFGVEPGPRLQEIQRAVLNHDETLELPRRRRTPTHAAQQAGQRPRGWVKGASALVAGLRDEIGQLRGRVAPRMRQLVRRSTVAVRRPAAAPRWLMASAGAAALLVLAVVLLLTVVHSGAPAHKREALADWAGISSPPSGGVYARGQWVATSFSCGQASGGPALVSCGDSTGTATASGGHGHLDTSTTGLHHYTVAVTVKTGATKTTTISYTVVPPQTVSIETSTALAAHSRTNVALACSGGGKGATCGGTLTLTVERRTIGRAGQRRTAVVETVTLAHASYSLAAGARRSIVVPLTDAGTLALRAAPGHRMRVQVTITVAGGATTQRTITLKRRR
jgi:DNA-binding SARP family transcriptional activator